MSLVSRGLTGVIALWRTLLNNGEVVMRTFQVLLRSITPHSNDNASQNESKWKFQWRKRRTVLFRQKNCMMSPGEVVDLGRPYNSLFEFQVDLRYVFIVV